MARAMAAGGGNLKGVAIITGDGVSGSLQFIQDTFTGRLSSLKKNEFITILESLPPPPPIDVVTTWCRVYSCEGKNHRTYARPPWIPRPLFW